VTRLANERFIHVMHCVSVNTAHQAGTVGMGTNVRVAILDDENQEACPWDDGGLLRRIAQQLNGIVRCTHEACRAAPPLVWL
jgi:hypothetical protein